MGLAGIDDAGARAGDRLDVLARQGRDSGHQLQEVERGALADQQSGQQPVDFGGDRRRASSRAPSAASDSNLRLRRRHREDLLDQRPAAED